MKSRKSILPAEEDYSPEVSGILQRKPSFFVCNGITLLLILVTSLVVSGHFIPYPERITIPVTFLTIPGQETTGTIRVTTETAIRLHPEQAGTLILDRLPGQAFRFNIKTIQPYGQAGDIIYIQPEPSVPIQQGDTGQATLAIGTTTMLAKLLTPILSVFFHDQHD